MGGMDLRQPLEKGKGFDDCCENSIYLLIFMFCF